METFTVTSNNEFELKSLKVGEIEIKKIKPLKNEFQHLTFPIMVTQSFPNGKIISYPIHPITYYSNYSSLIETDLVIDEIVDYCLYTKMKIYVPDNYPEVIKLEVQYENVIYKINELRILVVKQMDGYNYSLPPSEFNSIVQIFKKDDSPINNIFVPFDVKNDFEYIHSPVANYIIPALTGLNEEDLKQIKRIVFIDPRTNKEINVK